MKTHQGKISPQLHRCVSADQTEIRYKHDPEQILSCLPLWPSEPSGPAAWPAQYHRLWFVFVPVLHSSAAIWCHFLLSTDKLRKIKEATSQHLPACWVHSNNLRSLWQKLMRAEDKHSHITSLPSMQMHCCAPEARFHTVCLCDRQESHEVTWPEATETLMRAAGEFSSTETQHTLAQRARGGKRMEISDARQKANQSWWHHEYVHYIIEARSGYFP